jgi:small-conductance mechanosensitive channel/CRP-like cAMP-binding protein
VLDQLHGFFEAHAFDGFGIVTALVLLLLAGLTLPPAERGHLRFPALLVLLHLGLVGLETLALDEGLELLLHVGGLSTVLLSAGRSLFLLVNAIATRRRGRPLPRILSDILQGTIYLLVLLVVLRASGVDPGSLLTGSALVTAVIGLSLQETLGNLFAGLAIQAQQPFAVGDWIQFDAELGNIARVVEINWRATRLVTIDQVEITVPNGALARASIRNYSRPEAHVRRSITITAPSALPPAEAHRLFLDALPGTEGLLEEPAPDCQTIAFTDRGIEYRVRFWTTAFHRRDIVDGLVRDRVWYALHRAGLEIPGAIREVYLHETNQAAREAKLAGTVLHAERVLRAIDFFAPLDDEAVRHVAKAVERRNFAPNEVVIKEGDQGDELFLVERGELEVVVKVRGTETVVARLRPGEFFGEMSLMTGEKRRATVRTVGPTVVLAVGHDALEPVLKSNPKLAEHISSVLAEREFALGRLADGDTDRQTMIERQSTLLLDRIKRFFRL